MTVDHFDKTLATFKAQNPFRPFTVALVNGDHFEVDHRDAFFGRDGLAVYIAPGGYPVIFDHESVSQFIGDLMGRPNE